MTNITEKDTILLTNSRIRKETPSPMELGCKKIKNLKDIIQYKEEDQLFVKSNKQIGLTQSTNKINQHVGLEEKPTDSYKKNN